MYWYHPDHLGSSSFITGIDGEVNQNIEYFPSGETFVENHLNSYNTPYKYNSKELDDETGYYYYGARYYNPRVSLWLNVDPLAVYNPVMETEFYGDGQHNGGVYNSGNLNPYIYTYQNPIVYVDPNGKQSYSSILSGKFSALGRAIDDGIRNGSRDVVDYAASSRFANVELDVAIIKAETPKCSDCKSWMNSNYIGASSSDLSAEKQRKTGVEPIDEVDLAAYNHDVGYDDVKAAGVKGAVVDLKTLPADKKLLADSQKVLQKAKNGEKDSVTNQKITLETKARARMIIRAFEPLIKQKEMRIKANEIGTHIKK